MNRIYGLLLLATVLILLGLACPGQSTAAKLWYPYEEWSFENPSWSGNPFDLEAKAVFSDGKEPYLFYDGGTTWKLRYLCTQVGTFTFTTTSTDPELNGLTGSVTCADNPGAMGLLVPGGPNGAKFYVQGWERAIVPAWVMSPGISNNADPVDTATMMTWISNNLDRTGFLGVHAQGPANGWYNIDCDGTRDNCFGENPDPRTFLIYETFMDVLYQHGAFLHLWAFWDCQRDKCDKYHDDGPRQERLRRYIAARWGAIPNWMIGEGFDNFEDDSPAFADKWFNDINKYLPWHHFIGLRSYNNSYEDLCSQCNYRSFENIADPNDFTYETFATSYDHGINKPVFEEDRFRYRQENTKFRKKDVENLDEQRRWMWWQAMAGGVGAIYGYLEGSGGHYSRVEGYPEDWHRTIKGWHDFWYATPTDPTHRFMADMERCNNITNGRGLCKEGSYYVFFKEDTNRITFTLNLPSAQPAIAMDTKTGEIIQLGQQGADFSVFNAPYVSDWAVAVGAF